MSKPIPPNAPVTYNKPQEVLVEPKPQSGARLLSRASILSADDLPIEDVEVPEWGGTVRVRGLSSAERDAWEESLMGPEDAEGKRKQTYENIRAKLIARSAIDEAGNRLFTDADVVALGKKGAAPLVRLYTVALRLSRLRKEDVETIKGN